MNGDDVDEDLHRMALGNHIAAVSTLMPDGSPQTQLTWIDVDGEQLLINSQPFRQRVRNVRRDPRISVLIHSCDDVWDWVEARGLVAGVEVGDSAVEHVHALSQRYLGKPYPRVGDTGRALLRIDVQRVVKPGDVKNVADKYLGKDVG